MTALSPHERMRLSEEKAKNWINSVTPEDCDDVESEISSIIESSLADSSDSESGEEQQLGVTRSSTSLHKPQNYTDITELPNYGQVLNLDCVQNQLHQLAPSPTYSNISISNSSNVRFGNTIKIKGNLNINVINNNKNENEETKGEQKSQEKSNVESHTSANADKGSVPQQKREIYRPACLIIPRRRWLAMDPLNECLPIEEPINLAIICHTATASSTNQPGNIGIIRDMQTLHIETEGWNDIIYNFIIGCDGNVYEGRGWGIEGDHTFGYNNRSIGIAFVGSFSSKLPSERALKSCKNLLKRSVIEGHLAKDYKLLAQCQCSNNDSTGIKLFEEIQTWEHFYDKTKNHEILDRCEGE